MAIASERLDVLSHCTRSHKRLCDRVGNTARMSCRWYSLMPSLTMAPTKSIDVMSIRKVVYDIGKTGGSKECLPPVNAVISGNPGNNVMGALQQSVKPRWKMSRLLENLNAKIIRLEISSKHFTSVLHLSQIVYPLKSFIPSTMVQNTVSIAHSLKWNRTSDVSLFETLLLSISLMAGQIPLNRLLFKSSSCALLNGVIRFDSLVTTLKSKTASWKSLAVASNRSIQNRRVEKKPSIVLRVA
eukprot:scaffold4600_cov169-Amphora_coffeaeformis.AAC.6